MLGATAIFKYFFVFFIIIFLLLYAVYYYLFQKGISDKIGFSLKKKDWKSINNYVFTCGLTQNPDNLKNSTASAYEKNKLCDNLIAYFIKNEFHDINQKRYYILANSGMGKTFFLYKLLIQYSMNPFSSYKIYYVNIESGNADHLKRIEDIVEKTKDNKNNFNLDRTILLIDGLENLWDSDIKLCYKSYQRLLLSTEDFYKVITTSTIRFFSKLDNDLSNLDDSNSLLVSILASKKIYLPYFNNDDLSIYLKKMFTNSKLREDISTYLKKRSYIVESPLLLSYVDDLKGKNFPYFYRIHKAIIDKALGIGQNENYTKLFSFCEDIATFLYNNGQTTIDSDTLFSLLGSNIYSMLNIDDLLEGTKNILVTYLAGNYTFIHKSFYEYFLATKAIKDPDFRLNRNFSNLESAEKFFNEMCKANIYKNKKVEFNSEQDYRGYDFSNVNFKDCSFAGISLEYTTFAYAKLTDANLDGANFHNADLSYVIATNANFNGANLDNAILTNAILDGAVGISIDIISKNTKDSILEEKDTVPDTAKDIIPDISGNTKNEISTPNAAKDIDSDMLDNSNITDKNNQDKLLKEDLESKNEHSDDSKNFYNTISKIIINRHRKAPNKSSVTKQTISDNKINETIEETKESAVSKTSNLTPKPKQPNKDTVSALSTSKVALTPENTTPATTATAVQTDASFEITMEKGGKSTKLDMSTSDVKVNEEIHITADSAQTQTKINISDIENIDLVELFTTQTDKEAQEIMLPTLDKLINLYPDNATYHYFKGRTLGKLRKYEDALFELNSALILEPDNVLYHYSKSIILYDLHRFEDALSEIELASISQPNNIKYHYFRTNILINLYQFNEALLEIDFCLSRDSENAMYHHTKCIILYALRQIQPALKEINLAISKDPENSMYKATKAEILKNIK